MKLNLGCCDDLREGYENVDIAFPADKLVDLSEAPWPWEDSSVEEIMALDIIEHLPDKIQTMNELHRVLMDGGRVHIAVPTTDGRGAWQDPTHVSFWNRNTFFYFTGDDPMRIRFAEKSGITANFEVVKEIQTLLANGVSVLEIVLSAKK